MDTLLLARWQSGLTLVYHFLFVPLTLGLVLLVALMETIYVYSGNENYKHMARFWGQLYIINYALGFLTGLLQEFQFGMSWSVFSDVVGNIFGIPLAIETVLAFFLDATFFGMWLASWNIVSKKMHLSFIWLTALGVYSSAILILIANDFMQQPVGYEIQKGVLVLTNVSALLSNPNFLIALGHVISGGLITGAFFVTSISAWHLLKRSKGREVFLSSLRLGLLAGLIGCIGIILVGKFQIDHVGEVQPMKQAAMFGKMSAIPTLQAHYVQQYGPGNYIPFIPVVEGGFYIMVSIGLFLGLIALLGCLLLIKNAILRQRWFLRLLLPLIVLPYLANISGWLLREMGRQPWVIQGVLKTTDALSPALNFSTIVISLTAFTIVYVALSAIDGLLLMRYARRGIGDSTEQDAQLEQAQDSAFIAY
ncbi:cytochrome ubiquinol oxidase subunit I [Ktedonosporobacter rubrisoli]|uniref:Cytochrome ubiquinol oxidase subunit I n=1 Tax=Ktedonosporobacter rubrisoli TaxID=2509675 RepID=A0A4V0YZ85_KTERU|nr:cytochrome ubiquinol oxidase subunit I [Ktedonosporobacter rubrisoli]QBD78841.1 cytochrome ubiquinol oxidase subunit I [Ktedonosporobacter rubrisoli]